MDYSGAGWKLIHQKNQKQKISWHCPFKSKISWHCPFNADPDLAFYFNADRFYLQAFKEHIRRWSKLKF